MSQGRLFELLCLLLERGRMTAPQLAEHFEVSVRTIYRDIDALSAAGVPVYSTPGKGGGVSLLEGYTLHRAAFTEEEQQLLLTALRSLPGDAGQGTAETLSKLSALFRRREPDWLQVELSRWGSAGADNAKFVQLKEAILSRRVLSFTYVGASGQTTRRSVLPARLVFKGRDWYLQGFCLERAAYRTFKLTRMLEPEPGAPFQRPLSPPPIEGRRAAGGLLHPCPPALLPRPCLPGLRRIRQGLRHPRGGRQPRGVGELSGGSVALWLSALLWSGSGGVGTGAPAETAGAVGGKKWRPTTETMTRGVRITVIGWSHLNHRRNLT